MEIDLDKCRRRIKIRARLSAPGFSDPGCSDVYLRKTLTGWGLLQRTQRIIRGPEFKMYRLHLSLQEEFRVGRQDWRVGRFLFDATPSMGDAVDTGDLLWSLRRLLGKVRKQRPGIYLSRLVLDNGEIELRLFEVRLGTRGFGNRAELTENTIEAKTFTIDQPEHAFTTYKQLQEKREAANRSRDQKIISKLTEESPADRRTEAEQERRRKKAEAQKLSDALEAGYASFKEAELQAELEKERLTRVAADQRRDAKRASRDDSWDRTVRGIR